MVGAWLFIALHVCPAGTFRPAASPTDVFGPTTQPVLPAAHHDAVCRQDSDPRSIGSFVLKVPAGFSLPRQRLYHAIVGSSQEDCSAAFGVALDAWVTPWVDEVDPVGSSRYYVYLDPVEVARIQRLRQRVILCTGAKQSETSELLCHFQFGDASSWSWLPWPMAASDRWEKARQAEMRIIKIQAACSGSFFNTLVSFALIFVLLLLLLLLYMGRILMQMAKMGFQQGDAGSSADENAIIIPSMAADLKSGAMQTIRVTTLMMSLQWTILERIKKEADVFIMAFVALWPLAFGVFGILRNLQSLCHRQLAHAALGHGICLTSPARLDAYDFVTGLGMVLLAFCVAVPLAQNQLYVACGLVIALFSGPALSILGELQTARSADQALANAEGGHRIPALLQLIQQLREVGAQLRNEESLESAKALPILEEKIVQGAVRMFPFSALVLAGRRSGDVTEALQGEAPQDAGVQFNFLRDLWWHGRAILTMTRSYAGFLVLPLLLLPLLAMLASVLFQATAFLCDLPELTQLDLAYPHHGLKYRPWMHRYNVRLDASFKEAFLLASAEESSTKSLTISSVHSSNMTNGSAIFGAVELLGVPLPRSAQVQQLGLDKSSEYLVEFTPVTTLVSRITLEVESAGIARSLLWSEVPGAVFSMQVKTANTFSIDIYLADYEMGMPHPCGSSGPARSVFTDFCNFSSLGGCVADHAACCDELCRHDPNCLAASPGADGCFRAQHSSMRELVPMLVEDRSWLNRTVRGKICNLQGRYPCVETQATSKHLLKFRHLQLDWLDGRAELKLLLALAVGDQQVYSEAESLQLSRRPPEPLDVLVNLTGAIPFVNGTGFEAVTYLNATATVNQQDIEVTIMRYPPYEYSHLVLFVAVLMPDDAFTMEWTGAELEVAEPTDVTFRQCERSPFLQHRFAICRQAKDRTGGWTAPVLKVKLPTWSPDQLSPALRVVPKSRTDRNPAFSTTYSLKIRLADGVRSVGAWAVPAEVAGDESCRFFTERREARHQSTSKYFPADVQEIAANPQQYEILEALVSGAACTFVHRQCSHAHSELLGSIALEGLGWKLAWHDFGLASKTKHEDAEAFAARQSSLTLWRILQCSAEAGLVPSMSEICETCEDGVLTPKEPGFICCKPPGDSDEFEYFSWPIAVDELMPVLHPEANDVDAALLEGACTILKASSQESEAEGIAQSLFRAARDTANLQALNLTLRHCVRDLTPSRARDLWNLAETGMYVVRLVWVSFPWHVQTWLQVALDDVCDTCLSSWQAAFQGPKDCSPNEGPAQLKLSFGLTDRYEGQGQWQLFFQDRPVLESMFATLNMATCTLGRVSCMVIGVKPRPTRLHEDHLSEEITTFLWPIITQLFVAVSSTLTSLVVVGVRFGEGRSGDAFMASLHKLYKLRALELWWINMNSGMFQILESNLPAFPELEELRIVSVGPDSGQDPAQAAGNFGSTLMNLSSCSLRSIELPLCFLGSLQKLLDGLSTCQNLNDVNLCGTPPLPLKMREGGTLSICPINKAGSDAIHRAKTQWGRRVLWWAYVENRGCSRI